MKWEDLEHGISFENSNVFIRWNIFSADLENSSEVTVLKNSGQIQFSWRGSELLGLKGDWTAIFLSTEKYFRKIQLRYVGDDISLERFRFFESYLVSKLGSPNEIVKDDSDTSLEWSNGKVYIFLYLFEMHAYHCNLIIGIKE